MSKRRSYRIDAPAKINLGLEVIQRRGDGYHNISTIFAAVNLCDEIELRTRDDGEITCVIEGNNALRDEPIEKNLCVQATLALRQELQVDLGIEIILRKRIPTGAGLGGGSSNAAALLRGGLQLWERRIDDERLVEIATALGSDVPFFLDSTIAYGTSRGELLQPLNIALPWTILLVNPGIHVPTPWAYRAINRTGKRETSDLIGALEAGLRDPLSMRISLANDFEPSVFATYPKTAKIKDDLYSYGALFALMSGSGATVFGLFETRERAEEAKKEFAEYWCETVEFR